MREKSKKEENQGGTKERLQHRKEVKDSTRWEQRGVPGERWLVAQKKKRPGWKKEVKGPRKEVLRLTDYHVERLGTLLKVGESSIQSQADGKKQANY